MAGLLGLPPPPGSLQHPRHRAQRSDGLSKQQHKPCLPLQAQSHITADATQRSVGSSPHCERHQQKWRQEDEKEILKLSVKKRDLPACRRSLFLPLPAALWLTTYRRVYTSFEEPAQQNGRCRYPSKPPGSRELCVAAAPRCLWLGVLFRKRFLAHLPLTASTQQEVGWQLGALQIAHVTARGTSSSRGSESTPGWGEEGLERCPLLLGVPSEHCTHSPGLGRDRQPRVRRQDQSPRTALRSCSPTSGA